MCSEHWTAHHMAVLKKEINIQFVLHSSAHKTSLILALATSRDINWLRFVNHGHLFSTIAAHLVGLSVRTKYEWSFLSSNRRSHHDLNEHYFDTMRLHKSLVYWMHFLWYLGLPPTRNYHRTCNKNVTFILTKTGLLVVNEWDPLS